jgi:hypothetical protein
LDDVLEPIVTVSINNDIKLFIIEKETDTLILINPPTLPINTNNVFELSRQYL